MNTNFRNDSLESKLFALGQTAFEALSDNDIYNRFPECFPSGRNNGRAWNARKRVADATGWVMRSRNAGNAGNAGKTNQAIEHKLSMAISSTFKTSWDIHKGVIDGMPCLFSQESPELIVSDLARDWLQSALLSDKPNQFILSCSMANQSQLENDFRFLNVESKAMRHSRLAAEAAQRDRDSVYIAGLEKQGYLVICPDNSVSTGVAATLNRLELLVSALESKNAELIELKKSHHEISKKIGKLQNDDLTAANQKLASIQAECSGLAERMRKDGTAIGSILLADRELIVADIEARCSDFIEAQRATLAEFKPLLDKASMIIQSVALPTVSYTAEQEKLIGDLMSLLKLDRDKAIGILKGQGSL
jgi:hypothetical protein